MISGHVKFDTDLRCLQISIPAIFFTVKKPGFLKSSQ